MLAGARTHGAGVVVFAQRGVCRKGQRRHGKADKPEIDGPDDVIGARHVIQGAGDGGAKARKDAREHGGDAVDGRKLPGAKVFNDQKGGGDGADGVAKAKTDGKDKGHDGRAPAQHDGDQGGHHAKAGQDGGPCRADAVKHGASAILAKIMTTMTTLDTAEAVAAE